MRVGLHRLTDEESRKNWEEYGNPDGPQGVCVVSVRRFYHKCRLLLLQCVCPSLPLSTSSAATFGIALPSWIVDKKNSALVLGLYVLVFMVALPAGIVSGWHGQHMQLLIKSTGWKLWF